MEHFLSQLLSLFLDSQDFIRKVIQLDYAEDYSNSLSQVDHGETTKSLHTRAFTVILS